MVGSFHDSKWTIGKYGKLVKVIMIFNKLHALIDFRTGSRDDFFGMKAWNQK